MTTLNERLQMMAQRAADRGAVDPADTGLLSASRPSGAARRFLGTVKWFNEARGFGFIVHDGSADGAFFSAAQLPHATIGQRVEFDAVREADGFHAQNLRPTAP